MEAERLMILDLTSIQRGFPLDKEKKSLEMSTFYTSVL